jgi:hypothetical protein
LEILDFYPITRNENPIALYNLFCLGQVLNIIRKTALYFARTEYCRAAIEERADLSSMKEKPTPKIMVGLILIAFSYTIGLPTTLAITAIVGRLKGPLAGVIVGGVVYAISTILFFIGIKMAGEKYFHLFSRWLIRVVLEKILGNDIRTPVLPGPDGECS